MKSNQEGPDHKTKFRYICNAMIRIMILMTTLMIDDESLDADNEKGIP